MNQSKKKCVKKQCYIPAMLLFIFWPCVVHMEYIPTGLEDQPWFPNVAEQSDFFMQLRSTVFIILSVYMAVILLDRMLIQRRNVMQIHKTWSLLVYLLCVMLSAVYSVDQRFSLNGLTEQTETLWVLICYVVVFLYFREIAGDAGCVKRLISYLLAGAGMQCLIGLSQMMGHDFWSSWIGEKILLLGTGNSGGLEFLFENEGRIQVYMSFYHPNYAAVYIVLVLPFAVYGVRYFEKRWKKTVSALIAILLLINLWGTGSKAGFLTLIFLAFAGGLQILRTRKKRCLFLTGFVVCLCSYLVVGYLVPQESMAERVIQNVFQSKANYPLKNVVPRLDDIKIKYRKEKLYLVIESEGDRSWFAIKDEDGMTRELVLGEDGRFRLPGKEYRALSFSAYRDGEEYHITMYQQEIPWEFVKEDAASPYQYITLYEKADIPENAPFAFGKGYEKAFSERMYLWSRTVPLLKNYLLLGSGPNTFSLVFPQNDYVMRANIGVAMLTQIISRPHNIYLQCAIQTGMLSLLCLIGFAAGCLKEFSRVLKKAKTDASAAAGTGICVVCILAAAGFFVMGIANDSLVVTTPFFCAVVGIGCGKVRYLDAGMQTKQNKSKNKRSK